MKRRRRSAARQARAPAAPQEDLLMKEDEQEDNQTFRDLGRERQSHLKDIDIKHYSYACLISEEEGMQ